MKQQNRHTLSRPQIVNLPNPIKGEEVARDARVGGGNFHGLLLSGHTNGGGGHWPHAAVRGESYLRAAKRDEG